MPLPTTSTYCWTAHNFVKPLPNTYYEDHRFTNECAVSVLRFVGNAPRTVCKWREEIRS